MKDATFSSARLLELYGRISDAEDAIPRLRRLVLDLAVRGKLVEQDAHDKPEDFTPSDKSGKTLGSRASSKKVTPSVEPYSLPKMWKWVEIGDQLDLLNGMAFKPSDWASDGLRIVRIQNLNRQDAPFNYCDPNFARERSLIDDGSFLISWSGTPGTSFGAFIWDRGPAVLNQHIFRCDFKTEAFTPKYLRLAINGRLDEMIEKAHGGVGLQHITKGKLEAMLIGLPPLAEQHRIVAKVDKLMALCDQLEQARAGREAVRDRLTTASLARLTAPETDAEAFQSHARFALQSLPTLTTRPDQIKTLRQTILNLAVRGRLVAQDAADEPAAELLARIALEKSRLVKAGEIKKSKSLPPIEIGDAPFIFPAGWHLTRLGTVIDLLSGQHLQPPEYSETPGSGVPYITGPSDFLSDSLSITRFALVRKAVAKEGQLLLTVKGSGVGKTTMCTLPEVAISRQLMSLTPIVWAIGFLELITHRLAVSLQSQARSLIPGIARGDVEEFVFPLPPLAEQHRIVAKVDALMTLCDQLEASLTTTATTRSKLLGALLHEALAPAADKLEAAKWPAHLARFRRGR